MVVLRKFGSLLICLALIVLAYGCASNSSNAPTISDSRPLPIKPAPSPPLDEQLLDVAGEPAFKEEPDDPVAALSLINAGANVNARDSATVTVLMTAVRNGRIKVATVLLEHGADINAQDDNGTTALMLAAGVSDSEMVQLLLDKRANVNIKDKAGFTALSGSEMIGGSREPDYLAVRRMLKKAGAK
jgi:ankyrin repeat protein